MNAPSSILRRASCPVRLAILLPLLSLVPLKVPQVAAQEGPASEGPPPPSAPASVSRDGQGGATLRAHRVAEGLVIDGRLDEPVYGRIEPIGDFVQFEPDNGAPATEQTEVWVLFDDENFYVAGRAYDSAPPERWVLNEMRRDIPNVSNNESIAFSIDTFDDRRNGFLFELNAIGGFLDAQVTNENFPPNQSWNTVWDGQSGRFDDGWTFEIVVPFRSIRYQPGEDQVWGFNVRRVVRWKNEESHIVPVPFSLGQKRGLIQVSLNPRLVGVEVPPGSKNLEIRPFGIASLATDIPTGLSSDGDGDGGLDVKYGLTQNLTADFTVNTDFAQVEVDEQQVNLTRFSLFFPEKRAFFLEGHGIFTFGLGAGPNTGGNDVPTLFFSRRIGLSQGQTVPIRGGGRLTGKVGAYTIGLLNIQTGDRAAAGAASTNYSAVRLKRDILRRSAIGVIYTDRSESLVADGRARTYGVDGTFSFFDDLNINSYFARTETPGRSGSDRSYRTQLNYAGDRYGLVFDRMVIEENFNPEVGFVRRPDMRKMSGSVRFSPRPASIASIRQFFSQLDGTYIENTAGVLETRDWSGTFGIGLDNGDSIQVLATNTYEFLERPFPIATGVTVPAGGHEFNNVSFAYALGAQRRLSGAVFVERGTFYDGDKTSVSLRGGRLEVSNQLSVQPTVILNRVDLPFGDFTQALVSTRVVYTLTPRMFLAGLAQFNSSNDSVSTNLRLRWEYQPGSELFVVYNDQRDTTARGFPDLVNRAVIIKIAPLLRF